MSTYPVALRSALKAAPCLLMCMGMSTIVWLYMHGLNRHSQDHVPKHSFKYFPNNIIDQQNLKGQYVIEIK